MPGAACSSRITFTNFRLGSECNSRLTFLLFEGRPYIISSLPVGRMLKRGKS